MEGVIVEGRHVAENRNHFTGSPTHPYIIHQILVQHFGPGYRFKLT